MTYLAKGKYCAKFDTTESDFDQPSIGKSNYYLVLLLIIDGK